MTPTWIPSHSQPLVAELTPEGCLARCFDWLDALFIQRLGLQRVELVPELAVVSGTLRGTSVCMQTVRFSGPGFLHLTVARIETAPGRPCSLTVVGVPQPGRGLPILGMDLIALSGALSLVAVDLAPTDRHLWQAGCAPVLLGLQQQSTGSLVPRKRPEFTVDAFSSLALIAGAKKGSEWSVLCALVEFLQQTSDLWMRSLAQPEPETTSLASEIDCIRKWMLAEQANRKEHNALAAIFGPEFARSYLHDFLFAPPADSAASQMR
jgi:hypothetical protein